MKPPSGLRSTATALVAAILLSVTPALALHRESPGAIRLTSGSNHTHPSTRSWDRFFVFSSDVDLLVNGSRGRQIFLFSLLNFDCLHGTTRPTGGGVACPEPPQPYLFQITHGPGNADNPSVDGDPQNTGNIIAWDADGTGLGAGHRQIFVENLGTGEVTQVTNGSDGDSVRPSLSFAGGILVFESTASLAGVKGVSQIYAYTRDQMALIPITRGRGPSIRPMMNRPGTLVAFESTAALLSDGHDTGLSNIFVGVIDRQHLTSTITQLTNGNATSRHPYIAERDGYVAFESLATNLPGGANSPGSAIYRAAVDGGNLPNVTAITTVATHGNCTFPAIEPFGNRVLFICDGDPLHNGTTGNRVFSFNQPDSTLFQITGRGDVQGPIGANFGQWFVTFADNTDLTGAGSCGYQLFLVDYLPGHWNAATHPGESPPDVSQAPQRNFIGPRNFMIAPGNGLGGGSQVIATDGAGPNTAPLAADGTIGLTIGVPGQDGVAPVGVPVPGMAFPPLPIAGFGAFCLTPTGDGSGSLDCDGGKADIDLSNHQDHDVSNVDPLCTTGFGCRENDATCHGLPLGPHTARCPQCLVALCGQAPCPFKTCDSGPNVGAQCPNDAFCQAGMNCVNNQEPVCNGPAITEQSGVYAPGDMQLTVPVTLSLSLNPGADNTFCSPDDVPVFSLPAMLRLTTGTLTSAVQDANFVAGASFGATDVGAPFDCTKARNGDLGGSALVGSLERLDVPGIGDLILGIHFQAAAQPVPFDYCNAALCLADRDCDDGNPCNGVEHCSNRTCVKGIGINCDDGDACTADSCNAQGQCIHTPISCDDGNACTNDACNTITGCVHIPNANACNDNNACTLNDTCNNSSCVGTPKDCSDNNACTDDTCDASGNCQHTAKNCDDGNPCTIDSCDVVTGCTHVNVGNGTACSDGNACTQSDTCQNGTCVGASPVVCSAQDQCHDVGSCNPTTGQCSNPQKANGAPCNDGNPCTQTDTCQAGVCAGSNPVVCTAQDACHSAGVCDPATGACSNPAKPDGASCSDGNPCNGAETCVAGSCTPGTPQIDGTSCSDGNPCNGAETCQGQRCVSPGNVPDGTPCPNGNVCDGAEICQAGVCAAGTALTCNDLNPCTTDTCDPVTGCKNTPVANDTPCSDGQFCNGLETCQAGACTPGTAPPVGTSCSDGNRCNGGETCRADHTCGGGTPLNCDDGNSCTADSCDPATGCRNVPVADGTACDDGTVCNGRETCRAGQCSAGTPLNCDDHDGCTVDQCSATIGCTHTLIPGVGGLQCLLAVIHTTLTQAPAGDFGAPTLRNKLNGIITRALKKADLAAASTGGKQFQFLGRIAKSLRRFGLTVQHAKQRGRMDSALADELLRLLTETTGALSSVKPLGR